ncbi:MAG: DUF2339 domain-containing protein [Flavobacteriales bacterium]|nr:DUF2339 domain-containing protein [Flavobacteriales bacterium]MCW8914036.1 DUF2339 domain-containing protein [Flavobacteriales bacterium]MCW8938094.1 DUF2339 domain-containing protein [Flavobacteriales bacterium]MCW8941128.1 DUF2339 domain-containing protein [Flavobacteriales bacterium]MCW8968039.1 DUF2339 domain-containing protein [Flavobacteriales bacterium]
MENENDKIAQLLVKLEQLQKKHQDFSEEINHLKTEISNLRHSKAKEPLDTPPIPEINITKEIKTPPPVIPTKPESTLPPQEKIKKKTDIERFIGENLINKIGILITIIGVAIGAKYSIDNNLINPLTRIILGYLFGFGLLGIGFKLKEKYKNYSAVLLSGSMTIMYFITFVAYSLYGLMSQEISFGLMVLFTIFTVLAAIQYNLQVIAHIGLVGAYAVPFLLSDGSGKVMILFSYMTIINIGILYISFKKYWKPLYYSAFGFTWLIFLSWFLFKYENDVHFTLALSFLTIFFTIFYITFLSYKLIAKEKFNASDVVLLLINAFIFYGLGYNIFTNNTNTDNLLGLFTILNALIHFITAFVIYKQKLADKHLFHLLVGLVLTFITITIPVQLDGNWVSLLWAGEAAVLFLIGTKNNVKTYRNLSFPVMLLAFFSILQDWENYHYLFSNSKITAFINIHFLTSLLFSFAFSLITYFSYKNIKNHSENSNSNIFGQMIKISAIFIFLFSLYFTLRIEITNYWQQLYNSSEIIQQVEGSDYDTSINNYDLLRFKSLFVIIFSMLFFSLLTIFNIKKTKNPILGGTNLILNFFTILIFLTQGLYVLSVLRTSYLYQTMEYYEASTFNLWVRYIAYLFLALLFYVTYKEIKQAYIKIKLTIPFELILHTCILWVASSELINWMDFFNSSQSYKLGISILWGIYALLLIVLGLWKKKKYLRIGAISLFSITLIKLFFYDISHLNTIAKTIVFVSLGVLLLIISFLYNKYKTLISDETKN